MFISSPKTKHPFDFEQPARNPKSQSPKAAFVIAPSAALAETVEITVFTSPYLIRTQNLLIRSFSGSISPLKMTSLSDTDAATAACIARLMAEDLGEAVADTDAATEACIARIMAEDLGENYERHIAPFGVS